MALKVGGQCEGYGGLFEALRTLLPVEHAWYAEMDENASKVLAHHYPDVPNHGDITSYDWSLAEQVSIVTAGWPCQPFSHAGKRAGSGDERHLWPTGVVPAIRALMPPLFVGENVRGLLTIENGQVFAEVLTDLDDLGYTVSWTTIGACKVGACHHRHRVFLAATLFKVRAPMSDPIAHRAGESWGPAQFVLFGDSSAVKWPASGFTAGGVAWELPVETCGADAQILPTPKATDTGTPGRRVSEGWRPPLSEALLNLLPTPRTSDTNGSGQHGNGGLDLRTAVAMLPTPLAQDAMRNRTSPGDLSRKSPALEAVVTMLPTPTVADSRGSRNATAGRSAAASANVNSGWPLSDVVFDGQIQSLLPTPRASDGEKGGPNQRGSSGDVMLPSAVQPERFGKYATAVRRHEIAYGLSAPNPTEPGRNGKPRLSAAFPEFMQGLPAGWLTDVIDRSAALKAAGNGVNPRQAAYAMSTLPTFRAAVAQLTPPVAVAA
jgi:DNA (cytosine-5)-methyltransferase 1